MRHFFKEIWKAENFWQTMLCLVFSIATFESGDRYVSGFISAITLMFFIDCLGDRWPKYFKRMQITPDR